jgi:hypothetical protein
MIRKQIKESHVSMCSFRFVVVDGCRCGGRDDVNVWRRRKAGMNVAEETTLIR